MLQAYRWRDCLPSVEILPESGGEIACQVWRNCLIAVEKLPDNGGEKAC